MQKRKIVAGIGVALLSVGLLVGTFRLGMLVERNMPTLEVVSLSQYYQVQDEIVVLQDAKLQDWKAREWKGEVYLPLEVVQKQFLPRLYLDEYENLLILTTPDQVACYPLGDAVRTCNGVEEELSYVPGYLLDDSVWVSLKFLQQEVDFEAVYVDAKPGRLMLFTENASYLKKTVRKEAQVRTAASVKAPILETLAQDVTLYVISSQDNTFDYVLTEDGVLGYARKKQLRDMEYAEKSFEVRKEDLPESYTSITHAEPVVMVWHQVFNQTANSYLEEKLEGTQRINVISPTWFSIKNNQGELTSLANHAYVELAHSRGIEVWALVNDFESGLDYDRLYGSETGRQALIRNLFREIEAYQLDGINIDFENVTEENCRGYIQFLRELSVQCRKENIVLSIDNYVPMPHSAYYDRAEQGVLADYVCVMGYDEHYAGSEVAGSVSSLSWVKRGIEGTLEEVPAQKLVMGLPFYTRLWKERMTEDGKRKLTSEACSMNAGLRLAEKHGVTPEWREEEGQYFATWEEDGVSYSIWLEEERSIREKLNLVSGYSIGGVAFWKLGLEQNEVWDCISDFSMNGSE